MNSLIRTAAMAFGLIVATLSPPAAADTLPENMRPHVHAAQSATVTIYMRGPISATEPPAGGVGSGAIITPDGLVLTNCHVACDAMFYSVVVGNRRYDAEFVAGTGQNELGNDVAFIRITNPPAGGFPTLRLGDSDALSVGQTVVAIGSPMGVENTVTAGIVSALGRKGVGIFGDIQHDADIFGGNSGGPLLALQDGELRIVGMNTYVRGAGKNSKGLVFAVSASTIRFFYDQLTAPGFDGTFRWGRLGAMITAIDGDTARNLGVPAERIIPNLNGVMLQDVVPGGAAAASGLRPLDIILSVNGVSGFTVEELPMVVAQSPVGSPIPVEVVRGGRLVTVQVTLANAYRPIERPQPQPYDDSFGITLADPGTPPYLSRFAARMQAYEGNLVPLPMIVEIANGSPAHRAGLHGTGGLAPGMFIAGVKVADSPLVPVQSTAQLVRFFQTLHQRGIAADTVTFMVMVAGDRPTDEPRTAFVTLTPQAYDGPQAPADEADEDGDTDDGAGNDADE
jgi:S1-C subfamily serine protease